MRCWTGLGGGGIFSKGQASTATANSAIIKRPDENEMKRKRLNEYRLEGGLLLKNQLARVSSLGYIYCMLIFFLYAVFLQFSATEKKGPRIHRAPPRPGDVGESNDGRLTQEPCSVLWSYPKDDVPMSRTRQGAG